MDVVERHGGVGIAAGPVSASVLGGALLTIASLRRDGLEVLAAPADLPAGFCVHGQRAGVTLLHPWANRLGADAFPSLGADVQLDREAAGVTRDANGLPIHGFALDGAWTVARAGPASCTASATFDPVPEFPFPHRVEVEFGLADTGELAVTTTIHALTRQPVPIVFGWHPYFVSDRDRGCRLELPACTWLELDGVGLPTGRSTDWPGGSIALTDQSLDDGLAGLEAPAELVLHRPDLALRVRLVHGYPCAQVFAPATSPVVSLEPMTAETDALRRATGLRVAVRGAPVTARFAIRIEVSSGAGLPLR